MRWLNTNDSNIETNDAYRYGVARQLLNKAGYSAEMFVTYELQLNNVADGGNNYTVNLKVKKIKVFYLTALYSQLIYIH